MPKPTLVTVCLITYNQAQYIEECIDSILAQKVNFAWELVIADDCSTDGTRKILEAYKKQHPDLIHLILQKTNQGPEENWLTLLSHATSSPAIATARCIRVLDRRTLARDAVACDQHNSAVPGSGSNAKPSVSCRRAFGRAATLTDPVAALFHNMDRYGHHVGPNSSCCAFVLGIHYRLASALRLCFTHASTVGSGTFAGCLSRIACRARNCHSCRISRAQRHLQRGVV